MRRVSLLALFLLSLICASGCSAQEEPISIQKRMGKMYRFEAYKENIDVEKTVKPKEILKNVTWEDNPMDKDHPKPDYIFYFNDRKMGERIPVYYVWVKKGDRTLEVTKENQNKYAQIGEKDSAVILDFLQNQF